MINVGELIHDPDFCTEFIIYRKTDGIWDGGRYKQSEKKIVAEGIVTATSSKDMEMLAEGDRTQGLKTFYADVAMRLTGGDATADILEYKGQRYRLLQVFDYIDYGYYKAIGTLLGGI